MRVTRLGHPEAQASLAALRRFSGERLELACARVGAVRYREVIELYLRLAGAQDWAWKDATDALSPRLPLGGVLGGLGRDLLAWPWLVAQQAARVAAIRAGLSRVRAPLANGNVLFLRSDHWFDVTSGGSVGHLSGVVGALRDAGRRTQLVSSDRLAGLPSDVDFWLCEPHYGPGRNVPELPELMYNAQLLAFIEAHWAALAPGFVYQRYSLGNYVGAWLKQRHGVPFVCEFNGSFPWMSRHWMGRRLLHERLLTDIEKLNLHAADVVVVVSRAEREGLVARGVPAEKILVNPNGVDATRFCPSVDGQDVRRRYELEGKLVVGFIGSFGRWHGVEVLAEAFGRLLTERPALQERLRLLLIGDGATMPLVRAAIERHGVADACVLTGQVPQAEGPAHLAACDVLASPHVPNTDGTPFFGSPTKLFEYMAMGKAIVASDLDQIGEVLHHDHTAWLVAPGEAQALAEGLLVLAEDAPRRERLGRAAREAAVERHTWEAHTRRILLFLDERLGRSGE